MSNLGNWTTFDCPTTKEDEAFTFLKTKLNAIGATVRRKMNEHDFGPYPSFEIDIPDELANCNDSDDDLQDDDINSLSSRRDEMTSKIDDIESEFNEMFHSDDE